MSLDLTVTDLFCGAGGSSLGAEAAGARLRMAANHWRLAIETHNSNFPNADHDCADVSQVDPRRYPATDILIASPECTNHSQARSKKHDPNLFNLQGDPAAERSRATMWDVPRFVEAHRYQAIVVENVVEARNWPPFGAWLQAMAAYGYDHEILFLNSMIAPPTPQSRDRMYVVFWRAGNRRPQLKIEIPAWCPTCSRLVQAQQIYKRPERPWGKYRQQYLYRCTTCKGVAWPYVVPAAEAIDWELPAPRIADRLKPLAAATRRRIEVGLDRFARPMLAQIAGHTFERPGYARIWPVDRPSPAMTTTLAHALVLPIHHGPKGPGARPITIPWPTQTGRQEHALVVPLRTHGTARPAETMPFPTLVAGNQGMAVLPFIAELRGGWSEARPITDPLATVTAGGQHHGLVTPPAFVLKNYGDGSDPSMAHPVTDPLGTVTTVDHHSVVMLPFTVDYHGNGRAHAVTDPLGTQTAVDRHGLVEPALEVDDCGFRMLEPHEIGAAMAFPADYVVLGSKRDRVRQYGNAVTPPVMSLILQRVIESLAA